MPVEAGLSVASSGHPLANVRIEIVDANGAPLPERHIGEIALRSDSMLTGYYKRPDLKTQVMRDGWYLTCDLGFLFGEELFVTGRRKDLFIVGGRNLYPGDLEVIVNGVPGVHPGRVVVFGVPNGDLGTEDVAVVAEVEANDESDLRRISESIRSGFARQTDCVARHIHLVDSRWLIKTSSGKISRQANRDKFLVEKGMSAS
jgi:acyl-CoA synthetase (AMP-forming)/AMP-acid ligase II